ncbi:MAG: hypothetical protein IH991_12215 [Planctomycetes bacterium]|nr:hypothetical protein [Planctomycetota bacterium]
MEIANRHASTALTTVAAMFLLPGCVSAFVKPSNMVDIAEVVGPGESKILKTGTPQGTGGGVYRVPDGKVLVITRVVIQPMNPGPGSLDLNFIQSDTALGDRIRQTWRVPKSQSTQYDFSPGKLISSRSNLKVRNNGAGDDVAVMIYGYVTLLE